MRSYLLEVRSSQQGGQILIVLILTLAVVALVVLAVASRSVTDIKISQTSEESARAFSAAEAGVEDAVAQIRTNPAGIVGKGDQPTLTLSNNATVTYKVEAAVSSHAFLSSTLLDSDMQIFQVLLADYNNGAIGGNNYRGSSLCLFWGNGGAPSAIEASFYYQDNGGVLGVKRLPIDGASPARAGFIGSNNDASSCGSKTIAADQNNLGVDRTFQFAHKLDFTAAPPNGLGIPASRSPLLIRLRLLYSAGSAHYVGVSPIGGGLTLPSQGYKIDSTGQVLAGQTTRKVQVFVSYPALPPIFDFALFNGSSDPLSH